MATTRPQYVPTSDEMKDAVSVALKDTNANHPTSKELQKTLEEENPTWKLPQRRVRKFLNRELKNQGKVAPEASPEDDEISMASTTNRAKELAQATGRGLKKAIPKGGGFFSFRNKKQEKQAAAAAKEQSMPPMVIAAPKIKEETKPEPTKPEPVAEVEPVVEEEEKEKETPDKELDVYVDDNTGSKENQLCGGECIIL